IARQSATVLGSQVPIFRVLERVGYGSQSRAPSFRVLRKGGVWKPVACPILSRTPKGWGMDASRVPHPFVYSAKGWGMGARRVPHPFVYSERVGDGSQSRAPSFRVLRKGGVWKPVACPILSCTPRKGGVWKPVACPILSRTPRKGGVWKPVACPILS